jgi:YggT family protein
MWPIQPFQTTQPLSTHRSVISASTAYSIANVIHIFFGILEGLIGIRILLMFFGAGSDAGFSSLVYAVTGPFLIFFNNVFPSVSTGVGTLEVSSILAVVVYSILSSRIVDFFLGLGRQRGVFDPTYQIAQVVHLFFNTLGGLIGIRILLKCFGADPNAGFSTLVYGITNPFLGFFYNVFPPVSTGVGTLELSSILAILVYGLLSWGITMLILSLGRRQRTNLIA